jgi:hypothetical protein
MIVKICKKHGELNESQVTKEKNSQCVLGYRIRCHQCRLDKDRKWKINNLDKHRQTASRARNEARKLYREGIIDIEPRANVLAREDRKNNPEKHKQWSKNNREKEGQLRNTREVCRKVNIDVSYYYEMLETQNGLCKICNNPETRKSRTEGKVCQLAIDHCHKTGKIRGLLCHSCNVALGSFKDSIELLQNAINYLKLHEHAEGK